MSDQLQRSRRFTAVTVSGEHPSSVGASRRTEEIPQAGGEARAAALPLIEESVHVTKRDVVTDRVRVRTVVDRTEELIQQELETEEVKVTRVPIDRIVEKAPEVRTEGDVTIIPILEEILVVETKLLLKEEVHIRKTSTKDLVEQAVVLRKQSAIVENSD